MRRWLLILLVIAGLTPLTWVRSPPPIRDDNQRISVRQIDAAGAVTGDMTLDAAWHLRSTNRYFGSYSALVLLDDGQFLAASDRGRILQFAIPVDDGPQSARIGGFAGRDPFKKQLTDLEALVRDSETGRFWAGFEGTNTIERLEKDFRFSVKVRPKEMQGWSSNSGPEAMTRLGDGRFLVISEGTESWGDTGFPALIFPGDPVLGADPLAFRFEPPSGFRPVDMTVLPDGRVLVLVRQFRLGIPPTFHVKLVLADPAEIAEEESWSGETVATITDPRLADNYEGVAVAKNVDGSLAVWLISDDNNATLQRTLLVKLRWNPET